MNIMNLTDGDRTCYHNTDYHSKRFQGKCMLSQSGNYNAEWTNLAQTILKFTLTNSCNCKGKIKCLCKHGELQTFTRTVNKCGA
jgi:hypothetical protein